MHGNFIRLRASDRTAGSESSMPQKDHTYNAGFGEAGDEPSEKKESRLDPLTGKRYHLTTPTKYVIE